MHEWQLNHIQPLETLLQIHAAADGLEPIFHVHGSFGDVYCQCAAIKEALLGVKSCCVVIDQRYSILAKTAFAGHNVRLVFADGGFVNQVLTRLNVLGRDHKLPRRLLPTLYPMVAECIHAGILSYSDFLRLMTGSEVSGCFVPIEADDLLHQEACHLLSMAGAPIGRSVIVCTDNNSQVEFPEAYWDAICNHLFSRGWMPCINDAGTLTKGRTEIVLSKPWPKVTVPPHLPISIVSAAGGFIGGTNGFCTIQALFNDKSNCVHLINAIHAAGGVIKDKSGTSIKLDRFLHSVTLKNESRGFLKEIYVFSPELDDEVKAMLDNQFR